PVNPGAQVPFRADVSAVTLLQAPLLAAAFEGRLERRMQVLEPEQHGPVPVRQQLEVAAVEQVPLLYRCGDFLVVEAGQFAQRWIVVPVSEAQVADEPGIHIPYADRVSHRAGIDGCPDRCQLCRRDSRRNVYSAAGNFPILAMPGKRRVGAGMLPPSDVDEDPDVGEVLLEGELDEIGTGAHRPLLLDEHDAVLASGLDRWQFSGNPRSHLNCRRPRRLRHVPVAGDGAPGTIHETSCLADFSDVHVAVVGDLIADHYIYAEPRRLSREAP